MKESRFGVLARLLVTVCLVATMISGVFRSRTGSHAVLLTAQPAGIMGTTCNLTVVAPPGGDLLAQTALREAEVALRHVEALMSNWRLDSEVSRLNAAGADEYIDLPLEMAEVLTAARRIYDDSGGAFDVTCRPLIELWRAAPGRGLPTDEAIADARASSSWSDFDIFDVVAVKQTATARVDLGGIAKGYGIDRAVEAMQAAGALGGLVDVGGDVRVFGSAPRPEGWLIGLEAPDGGEAATLRIDNAAVCTSGAYRRFVEIDGRRYSHIIDPRTGRPAEAIDSCTVIGPTAMEADAWCTALNVLGAEGLALVGNAEMEACVMDESGDLEATGGFKELLVVGPAARPR